MIKPDCLYVLHHCAHSLSLPTGLKKKLKDLMGEFSELRARIHEENRNVVERRVYAVTGQHLPEEEIDQMIETGTWICSADSGP
jgi:syntaxin 1B/2/3